MEKLFGFCIENTIFLSLLVGVIFFITSLITLVFPPVEINYFYGYRTSASMKNQETWNFSQRFSSFAMMKSSIILIVISFINYFLKLEEKIQLFVGFGLILSSVFYIFYTTEKALKNKFPNQ